MSTDPLSSIRCIAIAGSAGAIEGLIEIFPRLKPDFCIPIVCVIHMRPDSTNLLLPILVERCSIPIVEAESGTVLKPGVVYFGPPDYHLSLEKDHTISLSVEPPVLYSRPSLDVFLNSAAEAYQQTLLAVLLSGANQDGSRGLAHVQALGGKTIVQDLEEALYPVMPESALKLFDPDYTLGVTEITHFLNYLGSRAYWQTEKRSHSAALRGGTFESGFR